MRVASRAASTVVHGSGEGKGARMALTLMHSARSLETSMTRVSAAGHGGVAMLPRV